MNRQLMDQATVKLDEAIAKEKKFANTLANGSERHVAMATRQVDKLLDEAVALEAEALAAPEQEAPLAA
jgi:hypothetical protein